MVGWIEEKVSTKGERLIVSRSIMANIPFYYVSLMMIPESVAKRLESRQYSSYGETLRRRGDTILWLETRSRSKLNLVGWV